LGASVSSDRSAQILIGKTATQAQHDPTISRSGQSE